MAVQFEFKGPNNVVDTGLQETYTGAEPRTDWLKIATGVANTAASLATANERQKAMVKSSEASSAKADANNLVMSEEFRQQTAQGRVTMIEGAIAQGVENRSQTYNDAFKGYIKTPYISEYDKQQEDIDNTVLNSVPETFMAEGQEPSDTPVVDNTGNPVVDNEGKPVMKTKEEAYGTEWGSKFVADFIKANPRASAKQVNNSLIKGIMTQQIQEINNVTDRNQLPTVLTEQQADLEPFQNTQFFRSRGAEGQQALTAAKMKVKEAIKLKEEEFRIASEQIVADNTQAYKSTTVLGPDYRETVKELEYLNQGKPVELQKKKETLGENVTYNKTATAYNRNVKLDEPIPKKFRTPPNGRDNWIKPKDLLKRVTSEGVEAYNGGNLEKLVNIMTTQPVAMTKGLGSFIKTSFTNAKDSKELSVAMTNFQTLIGEPGGGAAVRRTIGDDDFAMFTGMYNLAQSVYKGDVTKAKEAIDSSKVNPNTSWEKKLKIKMGNRDLGNNKGKYNSVMATLNSINGDMAWESEPAVAEYFESMTNDIKTLEGNNFSFDSSAGPNLISTKATDKAYTFSVLTAVSDKFFQGADYSMAALPSGAIQFKDEYGSVKYTINPEPFIRITNQIDQVKRLEAAGDINVGEIFAGSSIDIITGLRDSFDEIISGKPGTARQKRIEEGDAELEAIFEPVGDAVEWFLQPLADISDFVFKPYVDLILGRDSRTEGQVIREESAIEQANRKLDEEKKKRRRTK